VSRNSRKQKKLTKYKKKFKIRPKLSKEFKIMWEGLTNNGEKNKKII
jgi:hypothetical protein